MALFGSIFKGRGEKKEEPKAPSAPAAAPAPARPVPTSLPGRAPAGKTAPGAPQKPMQLDEIVAALQQIESIMAEPAEAASTKPAATSNHLQTVSISLNEIVQIVPSSFKDMQVSPDDKADVVIENLFGQMSKGKIETTLGYLLAGVPRQYLENPADLKSELKVSVPLPLVVSAVNPDDFKSRTARVRQDRVAAALPNLFATTAAAPAKPAPAPTAETPAAAPAKVDAFSSLNLKLADLRTVMPSAFKSAVVPPDARVEVPVEDVFGQLAKGKVEVAVNKLLSGVPKQYLAAGATLDAEVLVALPLSVIVSAIPADELKKRTAEQSAKPMAHDLPDLFKRADGKEIPKAAAAAKPAVPTVPKPVPAAVPKVEPKAPPVPEAKPVAAPAQAAPKPEVKVEPPPRPKLEIKPTEKAEPKVEPKPVAPAPKAAPVIPVPKAEPKPVAPVAPAAPPIPVAKPTPKVEPAVPFAGPAPKKFMPMDLVAAQSATPPPAAKPAAPTPKVEQQKPAARAAPVAAAPVAPAPVSASGIPVLLLRGLDLNQSSAEELMRVVDGIGEAMAQRIVDDRKENGPFFGLYDLGRVPGIGSKIYEKITGQPWLEEKYGQLPLVDELLGRWTGKHPDLKVVAGKFKEIAGFEGCMILHRDGDLLATSWQVESPDRLQAMAPQILKKVKHYMRHIVQGETYSVTVFLEGVSFTFVESEDICFVAVQNPKGLSRRHIQIINGLGVALGRRFSGYRGA